MGGRSGLIYMVSLVLNSSVLLRVQQGEACSTDAGPEAVFVFITVIMCDRGDDSVCIVFCMTDMGILS